MKKIVLILVMLIGISFTSFADCDLFSKATEGTSEDVTIFTEKVDIENGSQTRDGEVPVGAGSALLISLAGAYALLKKNENE